MGKNIVYLQIVERGLEQSSRGTNSRKGKGKGNVLIDMELTNLKNVFMFNYQEIRRRTLEAKIENLVEKNKEHWRNLQQLQAQFESVNERKKSLDLVCVKKNGKL